MNKKHAKFVIAMSCSFLLLSCVKKAKDLLTTLINKRNVQSFYLNLQQKEVTSLALNKLKTLTKFYEIVVNF